MQMAWSPTDDLTVLVDRLHRDRRADPYRGRREYSQAALDLADRCEALIDAGETATVVPMLRKAVDRMTTALTSMDDSSGIVGDDLQRIMDLYARACVAAPPNPKWLASWLVKLECDGPGWPRILLRDFAPALAASGLAEVERLVTERADIADPDSWTGQFAIRDLREQLAEASGDVDRYVQVLAEHLASAVQYARIVVFGVLPHAFERRSGGGEVFTFGFNSWSSAGTAMSYRLIHCCSLAYPG